MVRDREVLRHLRAGRQMHHGRVLAPSQRQHQGRQHPDQRVSGGCGLGFILSVYTRTQTCVVYIYTYIDRHVYLHIRTHIYMSDNSCV